MKRKLLSILLVLAMALTLLPVSALAEEMGEDGIAVQATNVAQVGETTYTSMDEALAAWAANGGTLTMLADAEFSNACKIQANAILDLNGKTLKAAGSNYITVENGATLTVKDSSEAGSGILEKNSGTAIKVNPGKLILESGTIKSAGSSVSTPTVKVGARNTASSSFEMTGGKVITTANYAIVADCNTAKFPTNVTITGGSVEAPNGADAIYIKATTILKIGGSNEGNPTVGKVEVAYVNNVQKPSAEFENCTIDDFYISYTSSGKHGSVSIAESVKFNKDISASLSSTDYMCIKDGEFYKAVKATKEYAAAAVISEDGTEAYYGTVSGAANAITSGQKLQLLKDWDEKVTINAAGVTIDLNGHSITNSRTDIYAYGLELSTAGTSEVKIINSSSDPATITAPTAISAGSTGGLMPVSVADNVTLVSTESDGGIKLVSGAYIDVTGKNDDEIASMSVTSGNGLWVTDNKLLGSATYALSYGDGTVKLMKDCSGSISANKTGTIDLNGHTFTYTGKDDDTAAFEISASDTVLTVKNGKIVSNTMVGLIPSAMKGTITYNNSSLVFEDVDMTANGHSGIETNGNNSNDTIILKNSTLNVPNGYGIYFPSSGSVTIENSKINAKTMGVQVCAGSLSVKNSEITVTAGPVTKTENDGAIEDGAAISVIDRTGYKGLGTVTIESGKFAAKSGNDAVKAYKWEDNAESKFDNGTKIITISGGHYTSDPSDYKADGLFVVESPEPGYLYTLSTTAPGAATVVVTDDTETNVTVSDADTKKAIEDVMDKAEVDGVAEAVVDKKDTIVKDAEVTPESTDVVEVEVTVKVEATSADLTSAVKTLTFTAEPKATVTVNGTVTGKEVAVPNSYLNGKEITIKLPLPAGFDAEKLEQVKHMDSNGYVEYFLKTAKVGAKTFTIEDNCVILKIDHFSTFELSTETTYVEPVYVPGATGYVVNVVPATNGTVSASHKTAAAGTTVTVSVSPANGYELSGLTVTDARGNALTLTDLGNGKYSFVMPASKVDVTAAFAAKSAAGFRDVAADAYYAPAVAWAVEKGITNGMTADLFAPAEPCTRGQIVTFLWRAAGSPAPKTSVNPFTDVTSADYYYNAVLWAVENGVTEGTSDTTFSPSAVCTRAQAVTFLCRALKGSASSAAAFTDVPADAYYAASVNWAVANGVTKGTSDTTFSPDASCTRAEIVTFLYRAYQGK